MIKELVKLRKKNSQNGGVHVTKRELQAIAKELKEFGIDSFEKESVKGTRILNADMKKHYNDPISVEDIDAFYKFFNLFLSSDSSLSFLSRAIEKKGITCEALSAFYYMSKKNNQKLNPKFIKHISTSIIDIENFEIFSKVMKREGFRLLENDLRGLAELGIIELKKKKFEMILGKNNLEYAKSKLKVAAKTAGWAWLIIVSTFVWNLFFNLVL